MSGALAIFGSSASALPPPVPTAAPAPGPRTWWNSVSPSQIVAYRTCPRKWYSASILGDREPSKGFQLRGDAIHKALEVYMSTGEVLPSVTMKDPNSPTGETTFSTLEFVQVARQHLPPPAIDAEFWAPHRAQDGGPLVEQAGEMATFPGGPNFVQFIDLVIAFGKTVPMEGLSPEERTAADVRTPPAAFGHYEPPARAIINDYKTSSDFRYAKTPEELAKDVQLNANAKWLFDVSDYEEIFVRHLYLLTKTVHPKSKISGSIVTRESVAKIWDRDMATVREMQGWAQLGPKSADALPPNTESCDMYGGCYYKAKCFGATGGSLFSIRKPTPQTPTTPNLNGRNMETNAPSTPSKGGLLATLMARSKPATASGAAAAPAAPAALGIAPPAVAAPVVGLVVPAPGVTAPPSLFAPGPISLFVKTPAGEQALAQKSADLAKATVAAAPALFQAAAAPVAPTAPAAPKPCDTDATHAGPCADPMCYVRSMDGIALGITPPDAPSPISTPEEVAAANAPDAGESDGMEPAPAADTAAPAAAPTAGGVYSAAGKQTRRTKAQMEAARAAETKAKEDALNAIVSEVLTPEPVSTPEPAPALAPAAAPEAPTETAPAPAIEAPTETEEKLKQSIDIVDSFNATSLAMDAPTAEPAPAGVSAIFGTAASPVNDVAPPTAPTADEVSGDLALLREKLVTPDASFECPVQALFIDCMPGKGWPGEAPKSFTDFVHAFEAAAASSAKALDYRLIRYESKGWLAVAVRVLMRGLPEAVYLDSRIPGADVFESVIAPYCKLIVRGTR